MKINTINLQNYKKNITGHTTFSNTFYTNPLSFGNDSFKKNDNAFEKTDDIRKKYEQINEKRRKKVYGSSLEAQEELMRENERILREYKKINEILQRRGHGARRLTRVSRRNRLRTGRQGRICRLSKLKFPALLPEFLTIRAFF